MRFPLLVPLRLEDCRRYYNIHCIVDITILYSAQIQAKKEEKKTNNNLLQAHPRTLKHSLHNLHTPSSHIPNPQLHNPPFPTHSLPRRIPPLRSSKRLHPRPNRRRYPHALLHLRLHRRLHILLLQQRRKSRSITRFKFKRGAGTAIFDGRDSR